MPTKPFPLQPLLIPLPNPPSYDSHHSTITCNPITMKTASSLLSFIFLTINCFLYISVINDGTVHIDYVDLTLSATVLLCGVIICETSKLDINEGIKFRGLSLPEVQKQLPTGKCRGATNSEYPIPEPMLWLLLTGEVPTDEEARQLSEELTCEPYNSVPKHARKIIDHLPVHQHPMSQYITGIMTLQTESKFAEAYQNGVNRQKYWKYALDDTMNLIAKISIISARIYRQTFRDGNVYSADDSLDWSGNWVNSSISL